MPFTINDDAIKKKFYNFERIRCRLHLKQDLLRGARILGLLNNKNKNINPEITLEVITQLSLLSLEYNWNIEYLLNKIEILSKQYPMYFNMIKGYFLDKKLKYFKDDSFNYNKFPKDIRSYSILERYNRTIKSSLEEKRACNLVIFVILLIAK